MNLSGTLKSYFGDRPENEMKIKKQTMGSEQLLTIQFLKSMK